MFGIALGCQDLIDHDALRQDPVLGVVLGRLEARRPGCALLAGKSMLNRLEHAPSGAHSYRRIGHDAGAIETLFVDFFLDAHGQAPERLILDLDASAGAAGEVARIVARVRERWSAVEIVLRADSGFAREELMAWCEANGVDYVFGLARNARLVEHSPGAGASIAGRQASGLAGAD